MFLRVSESVIGAASRLGVAAPTLGVFLAILAIVLRSISKALRRYSHAAYPSPSPREVGTDSSALRGRCRPACDVGGTIGVRLCSANRSCTSTRKRRWRAVQFLGFNIKSKTPLLRIRRHGLARSNLFIFICVGLPRRSGVSEEYVPVIRLRLDRATRGTLSPGRYYPLAR